VSARGVKANASHRARTQRKSAINGNTRASKYAYSDRRDRRLVAAGDEGGWRDGMSCCDNLNNNMPYRARERPGWAIAEEVEKIEQCQATNG